VERRVGVEVGRGKVVERTDLSGVIGGVERPLIGGELVTAVPGGRGNEKTGDAGRTGEEGVELISAR